MKSPLLLIISSFFIFGTQSVFSQDMISRQKSTARSQSNILESRFLTGVEIVSGEITINRERADAALKQHLRAQIFTRKDREIYNDIELLQTKAIAAKDYSIKLVGQLGKASQKRAFDTDFKLENAAKTDYFIPSGDDGEASEIPPQNKKAPQTADEGFQWGAAFRQSLLFLGIQHGYAFTQAKTRRELKGNFFKDYIKSVKSLHGWDDGGKFFTNYIAHPMQGSLTGFIQVQNDPKGKKQRFGSSGDYWRSRMKALAWSAAWSTQFEIGPISQASIGNVGFKGKQTYVDIVITPTVGTGLLITEDALDRFLIERIERNSESYYLRIFSRMLLNPTRTIANLLRFKLPWHRDRARAK